PLRFTGPRLMCGIVGFLAKDPALRSSLGELLIPMLTCMGDRGPDSAGLAVFTPPLPESVRRFSLFSGEAGFDWRAFERRLHDDLCPTARLQAVANHGVVEA